jgi:ATP-dependent Clp protease ATP-binding subunit ClpA
LPWRSTLATRIATGGRAQRLFRAAAEEADALQHHDIGLPHILLAILREPDSIAPLLERMGVPVQSLRDDAARMLDEELM